MKEGQLFYDAKRPHKCVASLWLIYCKSNVGWLFWIKFVIFFHKVTKITLRRKTILLLPGQGSNPQSPGCSMGASLLQMPPTKCHFFSTRLQHRYVHHGRMKITYGFLMKSGKPKLNVFCYCRCIYDICRNTFKDVRCSITYTSNKWDIQTILKLV